VVICLPVLRCFFRNWIEQYEVGSLSTEYVNNVYWANMGYLTFLTCHCVLGCNEKSSEVLWSHCVKLYVNGGM
jgi:hypothetical protein